MWGLARFLLVEIFTVSSQDGNCEEEEEDADADVEAGYRTPLCEVVEESPISPAGTRSDCLRQS